MKTLLIAIAFGFLFAMAAYTQTLKDELTWTELKSMQKEEVATLHNRQDSELKLLIDIQKDTVQKSPGTGVDMNDLVKLLSDEREKALAKYADERKALSQRQADERTAFLACNRKQSLPSTFGTSPAKH